MSGENNPNFGKHPERSLEWRQNHSEQMRGEGNPMYGKHHSKETRAKISAAKIGRPGRPHTEESRQRISDSNRRALLGNNPSAETREKLSQARLGKTHSEKTKQKIAESQLRSWQAGDREYPRGHSKSPGFHNGTWMRCLNSEGVFADQLDREGIEWLYEPKRFRLSWCTYLPDFYLPEFNIWIEVKGWASPSALAKMDTFRKETGKCLVLVYQSELERKTYHPPGSKWEVMNRAVDGVAS